MKIIVLGGGVIGVTTAYYLTEADHEVTLVERRQGETSFANGGQISAGHAAPWASPQVPRNLLKWLGKRNAPLIFHFKADPYLWAWSLRFLRPLAWFRTWCRGESLTSMSRDSPCPALATPDVETMRVGGPALEHSHSPQTNGTPSQKLPFLEDRRGRQRGYRTSN